MLAQQIAQQSLRRLATQTNASLFAAPAMLGASRNAFDVQRRLATAAATPSQQANHDILVKQRLNRPVAPHLTIYRPQVTWYLSALNRITGCVLSGGFYAYGALYLIAPTLGWHVESSVLAASFAAWPAFLAITTKALVAFPFTFHCLNGLRHLTWDTASMITNKQVTTTGWAVVYASIASAVGLAFL